MTTATEDNIDRILALQHQRGAHVNELGGRDGCNGCTGIVSFHYPPDDSQWVNCNVCGEDLDEAFIDSHRETHAARFRADLKRRDTLLSAAAPALVLALQFAIARVELANTEGDPILSAWLPEAREAVATATGPVRSTK